jgi:predicted peroxiredoxin
MPFIIAMDYDDTLVNKSFPEKGIPNVPVVEKTLEFCKYGAEVVLWTCREGKMLQEAVEMCKEMGIKLAAINKSAPSQVIRQKEQMEKYGETYGLTKIFANIYVDDRAHGSIDFYLQIDAKKTCENFLEK